jgi:Spy/CpxP family protein refolding chaperone
MNDNGKSASLVVFVSVCAMAIALAGPASAASTGGGKAPERPPPFGYPTAFLENHAERIELSDETMTRIREVFEKSRSESVKFRKETVEEQKKLHELLAQDLPDEKAVMAQADKIARLAGEQRKNQLRAAIRVRSMLTPKQRAELDKIRKEKTPPRQAGPGGPRPHAKKPPFGAGGAQGKSPANPDAKPRAAE